MSDGDSFVLQSFINQWPSQSVCQVVSSGSRTSRVLGSRTELHYLGHSQSLVGVFAMFFSGCCSTQVAFPSPPSPPQCVSLYGFVYYLLTKAQQSWAGLLINVHRQTENITLCHPATYFHWWWWSLSVHTHEHRNREAHSLQQQ